MDFPDWITQECADAINRALCALNEPSTNYPDNLHDGHFGSNRESFEKNIKKICGLLNNQHPSIKEVWRKANERYSYQEGKSNQPMDPNNGQLWLCHAILLSFPLEIPTKELEKKWLQKTQKSVSDLINLLSTPPKTYEKFHSDFYFGIRSEIYKLLHPKAKTHIIIPSELGGNDRPINYKNYLTTLVESIELQTLRGAFWGNQRTKETGDRIYFVRSLTHQFLKRTGEGKTDNVRYITNFLYRGRISETQIIDRTKDIKASPDSFPHLRTTIDPKMKIWRAEGPIILDSEQ